MNKKHTLRIYRIYILNQSFMNPNISKFSNFLLVFLFSDAQTLKLKPKDFKLST